MLSFSLYVCLFSVKNLNTIIGDRIIWAIAAIQVES